MPNAPFIQVILPLKLTWEPYYRLPADLDDRGDGTETRDPNGNGRTMDTRINVGAKDWSGVEIKTVPPAEAKTEPRLGAKGGGTAEAKTESQLGAKSGGATEIKVGSRVRVNFAGKEYVGVVSAAVSEAVQADGTPVKGVKEIEGLAEGLEPVTQEEIQLWRQVADYYLCTVGEVYKAAYPAMKVAGEAVEARKRAAQEARRQRQAEARKKKIETLRSRLAKKQQALERARKPETRARYSEEKEKIEQELAAAIREYLTVQENTQTVALGRAASLRELPGTDGTGTIAGIATGLQSDETGTEKTPIRLSDAQSQAYSEIIAIFRSGKPALLHGVTGSGKTEIYLKLAQKTLAKGKNVLYLVPEIALSKQLEDRLADFFPQELQVFHSGETMAERREVATFLRNSGNSEAVVGKTADERRKRGAVQPRRGYLVLGTRSALFLPHRDLGLIIVDEEHDTSYKQDSPAPRYNGRETAIMLAGIYDANIVLGSATPSLESLYNCSVGRFGRVLLTKRFFDATDSDVEIVDTIAERRKNGMVGQFSRKLIAHIQQCLDRGEQAVVLRERRSYSPLVQCEDCGHIPQCKHCNVRLSLHKRADGSEKLVCHYCGRVQEYTGTCPQCGGKFLPLGAGTQQIEEEARKLFPDARIARLDSDSAQNRAYETEVIRRFAAGSIDMLIGTQIVTKGFDFSGLRLVAVLQADSIMGQQDFRADEKGLQLLEQFRGRCGRRGQKGLFVIQTSQPDHPVYRKISGELRSDDLQGRLLAERKLFGYPPYSRVIGVVFKDYNPDRIDAMSRAFGQTLRARLPNVLSIEGPYSPAIDKISGQHIRHLRVLLRKDKALAANKKALAETVEAFERERRYSGRIALDVDPV
jgi:primosomal protein N' (replication factor Y)